MPTVSLNEIESEKKMQMQSCFVFFNSCTRFSFTLNAHGMEFISFHHKFSFTLSPEISN